MKDRLSPPIFRLALIYGLITYGATGLNPKTVSAAENLCGAIAGPISSPLIPAENQENNLDRSNHPDFNLEVRGWEKSSEPPTFSTQRDEIDYVDPLAPDLTTLLRHRPVIKDLYRVGGWDWSKNSPRRFLESGTMVGIETVVNEPICAPSIGYDIGLPYKYLVIYADNDQIAINSTRQGDVSAGYTINIKGIRVSEPILKSYQQQIHKGEVYLLPAITGQTILGQAKSVSILLTIRDTSTFMRVNDPADWGFDPSRLTPLNRP